MKRKTFVLPVLLAASLVVVAQLQANVVTVSFTATIENSPFLTAGYTIGSVINGSYVYDSAAMPADKGLNYTDYGMQGMNLLFGATVYQSLFGSLNLVHYLPSSTPNATDEYDLFGFSLTGPAVEGFSPAFSELKMIDTDNSVYAAIKPPYPLDLPDPALFEIMSLRIGFLQGPASPPAYQEINARIDTISTDQIAPVPDGGSFWLFGGTICLLALAGTWNVERPPRR